MADLKDKIKAEFDNIDRLFDEMPALQNLPHLSTLELAGVATLLHNFYNGIENIIKQILYSMNVTHSAGGSWHRELLNSAVSRSIISDGLRVQLGQYLAFRHFISHSYALDIYPKRIEPLLKNAKRIYDEFKIEIEAFI